MSMLQDILGMFKRKIFRTPTDEDVFIVGKLRQSRNKFDDPKIDQTLVKLKDLKTAIGGVNASNTGAGEEVLQTPVVGSNLKFRSLRAGSNITLTQNADDIQIDAAGGGLDNYDVPKGYSPYPFTQYVGSASGSSLGANDQLYFSEPMKFQVYQDTEINKARLNIVTAYAGEVYKAGLYKYDFDNHKMVLVTGAEWDFPADVAGAVTIPLSAPLTISAGTYYVGLIQTIGFPPSGAQTWFVSNVTSSSNMPTIRWWDNNLSPVAAAGRITRMRYTTPTAPVSSMPTEILWADMTLQVMANYPILATLVF